MWLISLTLIFILLTFWITWRKEKLNYFKRLNIPGPEPNLLFGNYWELLFEGQHSCISRWIKQYGRVFGYYHGIRPVLIVADVDMLRVILVKDFQKFIRPALFAVGSSHTSFNHQTLFAADRNRWKELRSIMSPSFTASKLKRMSPVINHAVDELLEAVEKKSESGMPFDIYHIYQNLSMDVIARASLGVHTKCQAEANDPFVKLARIIFTSKLSFLSMFTFSLTEFMPIFSIIRYLKLSVANTGKFPRLELEEKTSAAITARRNNPEYRRVDLLQLMMDGKRTEGKINDKILTAGENEEFISNGNRKEMPEQNGKGMTDEEIIQNAVMFLLAGYETTSTALAFLTYCLVYHTDVQDKIREEILDNISDEEELSYDVVNKLQYLDRVMTESMRLYPPVTYFVNREAAEDIVINNTQIPKGLAIQVPTYYLHYDPTLWEDPEKFYPDRFSPENKSKVNPLSFQTFGAGPRNCVGMRFAQMEIKMAVARLLRKYRLLPIPGTTKESFKIDCCQLTMRPKEGLFIQVESI